MPLSDIIEKNVVTIQPKATIKEAIKLMRDEQIGTIVVVDSSKEAIPLGIVTDRDIALFLGGEDTLGVISKVQDVMTPNVVLCSPKDGISETIDKMRTNKVRRMPVVNDEDQLVGIVASDDLFRLLGNEINNLSQISTLRSQVKDHSLRGNDKGEIANLLQQYS